MATVDQFTMSTFTGLPDFIIIVLPEYLMELIPLSMFEAPC